MSDHVERSVLIVGAGRMAKEYAAVLQALGRNVFVIGRGAHSARKFSAETGIPVWTKGLSAWCEAHRLDTMEAAIVAVSAEQLAAVTCDLLRAGGSRILVEKPGGLNESDLQSITSLAAARRAHVYVAYNRRHYASVLAARRIIAADGGVQSLHFDFTEHRLRIASSSLSPEVKDAWLIANSSHVIDLAFYVAGEPRSLAATSAGGLPWHRRASRFSGSGVTFTGALFSYHANWEAPGNWSVEWMTPRRRLRLSPLEQIAVQAEEGGRAETLSIDDRLDRQFKPGLYRLVRAFLCGAPAASLMTIGAQLERYRRVYAPMLEGNFSTDRKRL